MKLIDEIKNFGGTDVTDSAFSPAALAVQSIICERATKKAGDIFHNLKRCGYFGIMFTVIFFIIRLFDLAQWPLAALYWVAYYALVHFVHKKLVKNIHDDSHNLVFFQGTKKNVPPNMECACLHGPMDAEYDPADFFNDAKQFNLIAASVFGIRTCFVVNQVIPKEEREQLSGAGKVAHEALAQLTCAFTQAEFSLMAQCDSAEVTEHLVSELRRIADETETQLTASRITADDDNTSETS